MKLGRAAFTLLELMVSLGASVVVIGGLLISSVGLQKTLFENGNLVEIRENQRRVLDYIGRELRRAVSVASKDSAGLPIAVRGKTITLASETPLIFTLPGYYRSNNPSSSEFDQPLDVIATSDSVAYGDSSGAAPAVLVWITKAFIPEEGSVCLVRRENDTSQIIVRSAEALNVRLRFSDDGYSCRLESWVRTSVRERAVTVWTYDTVLLRNADNENP